MRRSSAIVLVALAALCTCGSEDGGGEAKPPPAVAPEPDTPVAPPAAPAGFGSITGTVLFTGTPPARENLTERFRTNEFCRQHAESDVLAENTLIQNGRIENVLVYIDTKKGDAIHSSKYDPPSEPVHLTQRGCSYIPHVILVRLGQTLQVHNEDNTPHNITFNTANQIKGFTQAGPDMDPVVPTIPEIGGRLSCEIHGWMGAYLHVFKHPFFALTGADGAYTLTSVPAGTYTLVAWHERMAPGTREVPARKLTVTVEPGKTATVDFEFTERDVPK